MSDKLQQAITTIKSGDKETGKQLLIEILKVDQRNEVAWLWMTNIVSSEDERAKCLQNVLKINPDNETAKRGLAILQQKQTRQPSQVDTPKTEIQPKPQKPLSAPEPSLVKETTKQCPYCAETIKAKAKFCRFCGRNLSTGQQTSPTAISQSQTPIIIQSPPVKPAQTVKKRVKQTSQTNSNLPLIITAIIVIGIVIFGCCKLASSGVPPQQENLQKDAKQEATPLLTSTSPITIDSYGVEIGTTADEVLAIRGKAIRTVTVGQDSQGLIVEWVYPDVIYTMKRWEINGVTAYRVQEIELR